MIEKYVFKFNDGKFLSHNPKDPWTTFINFQIHKCNQIEEAGLFTNKEIAPYIYDMQNEGWGKILKVLVSIQTVDCD